MTFILLILSLVSKKVNYKGNTLKYFWKEKIIWLIGDAEVKTQDIRAKADTIKYNAQKDMVIASGNPILWVGSQEIKGTKMLYNLETHKGIIENGRTKIQKGWFDGKIMKKVGPKELNIEYGKFTTCNHSPPHYYFWGRRLKVYPDNMVFTKPLVLFVQDIPLFYALFWWFPIKEGRQSGLLHPKIGKSRSWGRYVENLSYFWVINKWSDATFTLNYFEFKGPQFLTEGRWLLPPNASGYFKGSYIAESKPNTKDKLERWTIDFSHTQNLKGYSIRANGAFLSDDSVKVDYEEERIVQLDKILDSYLSISKSWDIMGASFVIQERRDLSTDSAKRTLPNVTYYLTNRRILWGNFSFSGSFTNSTLSEEYKQVSRNSVSFLFPFTLFKYLYITPSTSHTYTFQSPERVLKPYDYTHSISVSTRIYGKTIFKPEFRHTIRPKISYSIRDTVHNCSFSISNDFYLLIGEKKLKLAILNINSSWNFELHQVNPLSLSLYSSAIPLLNARAFAKYRPYDEEEKFDFETLVLSTAISRKEFSLSMTYNWTPREIGSDQSLGGNISVKLTTNWKLSLYRRYDFIAHKVIGEEFSISRDLHCWSADFSFDRLGENWRYDFSLKLKALPEIKVGKGLFGIFVD